MLRGICPGIELAGAGLAVDALTVIREAVTVEATGMVGMVADSEVVPAEEDGVDLLMVTREEAVVEKVGNVRSDSEEMLMAQSSDVGRVVE